LFVFVVESYNTDVPYWRNPPQSVKTIWGRGRALLRVALLSCGLPASRRRPPRSSIMLVRCSRLVVATPPRGLRTGARAVLPAARDLPQAWPHFRVLPKTPRAHGARSLSRGLAPPQRNPSAKVHLSRVLPARVSLRPYTYHVPRRLTPLANSLVSFQPGAFTGCHALQSLT
jgi:hypothetical protein